MNYNSISKWLADRERLFVMVTCMGWFVGVALLVPATIPVHKTEIVEKKVVKVVEEKRVVIPVPSKNDYTPIKYAREACLGAVVEVISVMAQGNKESTTYFTVRPVADDYKVACQIPGDWSKEFKAGDIIALPGGVVSGVDR